MSGIRFKNSVIFTFLALIILSFFAGCNSPKDQLAVFNGHFERFDYEKSAQFAEKKISKKRIRRARTYSGHYSLEQFKGFKRNIQTAPGPSIKPKIC